MFAIGLLTPVAAALCMSVTAPAEDQAVQTTRNAARLADVKKIAPAPVVIQLRFDRSKDIPDPNRLAARVAASTRLIGVFEEKLKGSAYQLAAPEAVALALKEMNLQPVGLYTTRDTSQWDAPAEVLKNRKGDEAALLTGRDPMNETPADMTCYRFRWHDLPDTNVGLAAFRPDTFARVYIEKAKTIASRVGADSVLLLQVTDMEVHVGSTMFESFRSTRITVHATLLAANDGAVLWQSRAKGVVSQKAGYFTGAGAFKNEERAAVEAMTKAVDLLVADLVQGTGKPAPATGTTF